MAVAQLRFDGQVVIVTGAGSNPGLGRSYARFLAARGARVVVNDLGVGPDGRGITVSRADAVVEEIRAAGGEAVADTHSVATQEGALAVVQTAIDAFGQVDALVNNAGVLEYALMDELTPADIEKMISSHLMGAIWMCRAVWPHMRAARSGRIVNTVSGSVIGAKYSAVYGSAKAGVFGLTRNLAIEAEALGIKVNSILPSAATVAWLTFSDHATRPDEKVLSQHSPDNIAPALALLVSERVPFNGRCFGVNGTNIYEVSLWRTEGVAQQNWTPEQILARLDEISSRDRVQLLGDPFDGQAGYTLQPRDYSRVIADKI
ncbi:SDR family NAD(P)-dependent oxidoreductase [Bradyrhizobium liaoningense]|uniref:SDR family NAD(P)-dependent oxidoreductase n=1 Tax=Bradyrhizobium liaoningense TaxID=43992 RepID=UPI001BAC0539|nr:SDR family NAD(P)-dependent oxidoreductase [Bradyrhizobium liaoningense]MBR0840430.1 SDR family NAD(P)-dependent oxidoreductase [Bradyrhizobium liaoningense]